MTRQHCYHRQDGVTENITDFQLATQGIDMNTYGKKTIKVTYQEDNFIRTADVEIAVAQISLKSTLAVTVPFDTVAFFLSLVPHVIVYRKALTRVFRYFLSYLGRSLPYKSENI